MSEKSDSPEQSEASSPSVMLGHDEAMKADQGHDVYAVSDADLERINGFLHRVGGPHVQWGAGNVLDVWVTEQRMKAEERASQRLLRATWVLAAATVALVLATVGLIVVAVVG